MKAAAIILVVLLAGFYLLVGLFGLGMSAFCFDSGTGQANWECAAGINAVAFGPSALAILAAVVLLFLRRWKAAMIIAAIPAVLLVVFFGVVMVWNMVMIAQIGRP